MRIDDRNERQREEAETNRIHRQASYRYALQQHIKNLKRYGADIGGGSTYPLITWSGAPDSSQWGFLVHCPHCSKEWFIPKPTDSQAPCAPALGGCGKRFNPNAVRSEVS